MSGGDDNKGGGALLRRLLSSEVKAELLVLFHKNPELIDTVEGVARRILRRRSINRSEILSLDRAKDKEIQEKTAEYIQSLKRP